MTPAQLRKLAADPRFIPGIYNYCDRWCERCPISHRCLNYATLKAEDDGDPAARDYGFAVQKWIEASSGLFKAKGVELERKARLDVGRPLDEAEEIREMLEIIQWYHLFIHVKLARAIGSHAEEELETDPELRALLRDGDGSAKIALIGVDRSLAAWAALRPHFPEQEDAILDFQLRLARLRRDAEKLFPNARAFVRAGFDEGLARLEVGG